MEFYYSLLLFPFVLFLQVSCYGCEQCDLVTAAVLRVFLVLSLNSPYSVKSEVKVEALYFNSA